MPPRLSRRQQREVEKLEELSSVGSQLELKEDADEVGPSQGVGFLALDVAISENASESEREEENRTSKKSTKKKRKPDQDTSIHPSPVPVRNEKKAAKKARAKKTKAENDELNRLLAEISAENSSSQKTFTSASGKSILAELLSVSPQFLDGEAEMKRFFGSKVVLATKSGESSRSATAKKVQNIRSNLVRPQATWWPAQTREGLSLIAYSEKEVSEKLARQGWESLQIQEKWWTVEYSRKYKKVTKSFMSAVMAGDPQGLFNQLGTAPWHADTLLQIAEVYRHREEHAPAVDFIERSMFAYERCLMGVFNFSTGLNRLDFDRVENRPFFLAVHRQVADLQRRGCVRTSFEFARLLYGLDPWNDPHGAVFHLEYLAIKANMHQWFLDLYDIFLDLHSSIGDKDARLNVSLLPGWAYSRALVLRLTEDKAGENSVVALQQAANDFPSIVPLLADKLDVSLPSNLRSHKDFKIETDNQSLSPSAAVLHLLSHLYVQRCSSLWKEHATWFSQTISEHFSNLPRSLPRSDRKDAFHRLFERSTLRHSIYRHIQVLDGPFRRLFSFVPREIFEGKSLACDPLPPPTSLNFYDDDFFHGLEDTPSEQRRRAANEQDVPQLLRQHLQEFLGAHPRFAQRFPGGIDQFFQMMAGMPPDVVEEIMLAEAMQEEGGRMPGGFDGFDDE